MECRKAQELLSAYYDDELSSDLRSSVAEHVQACSRCGEERALFEELSAMAKGLDDPEPPPRMWEGIEAGLDADRQDAPMARPAPKQRRSAVNWRRSLLATATLLMIATGAVWIAAQAWHGIGRHHEMAADFSHYLEQFHEDPELAQNVLLAKYDGQAVTLSQAASQLGYTPAVSGGLPDRYTLDAVYVLKMPCCTCVQSICRRDDGRLFAIFEHNEEQPAWFGDKPRIDTQCDGCQCSVIQADHGIVASWKGNKRQFTVIGARDLEDISDLIVHFQGENPNT